ncbi:MAG: hypothetical protein ACI9LM_004059 [Alteromonadaceae bacterium]|jgi:hypothetical protein
MRTFIMIFSVLLLSSCTTLNRADNNSRWDFDHDLQFKETKLADNKYHLEIIPKNKTYFSQLATFLMRHSYQLCGQYGYNLEILDGVEGFNDRAGLPHLIQSSLSANVECKK